MSGYASRTGVFEVMTVTREVRRLVMEKQPLQVIRRKAAEEGTVEFRQAALLKVARGETAVEEVFRAVPSEYINADD
jgi:type II secretory ATPase GspE/PulE/Tfp pilus assembly ATPase PilB-like protein